MKESSEKWWARNYEQLKERKETVCLPRVGKDGGYALQCPVETDESRFSFWSMLSDTEDMTLNPTPEIT